jgi:hypothetical protein
MKFTIFVLPLVLATSCFAAPRDVTITLKKTDGGVLEGNHTFSVAGPKTLYRKGVLENGQSKPLALEPGLYSLHLWPSNQAETKTSVPGKVWHGLAVRADAEGAVIWDLKVPPIAAIQGRILLSDGKPAVGCLVSVQSGTQQALSYDMAADINAGNPAAAVLALKTVDKMAFGTKHAYSSTRTDENGVFVLKNLVPGNYALDVFHQEGQKWFTIPFAPALEADAKKGEPTKLGEWKVPENGWDWLFDNKLKHGASESKYIGQGKVTIENGVLRLGVGDDMTGVNWPDYDKEKLPRQNYEISFDARRVEGNDFFTGLTFPYDDKPISWIVGGWGGSVVGLSNVNGFAAVENETTRTMEFEDQRWYRLRLRVSKPKIEAWIDEEKVIDFATMEKEFSIRWSVEPSLPLGFVTWKTGGELRDIRIRKLDTGEIAAIEKSLQE